MSEIEKDWRGEVRREIYSFYRKSVQEFNQAFGRAIEKAPLLENRPEIYESFAQANVDVFFHLFSGFVGCEFEFEENLKADLQDRFKKARLDKFAREMQSGSKN